MLLFPPPHNIPPPQGGRKNLLIFQHPYCMLSSLTTSCSPFHTTYPHHRGEGELIFQHAYYILSSLTTSCSPFHTTYPHHRGRGVPWPLGGGRGGWRGWRIYIYIYISTKSWNSSCFNQTSKLRERFSKLLRCQGEIGSQKHLRTSVLCLDLCGVGSWHKHLFSHFLTMLSSNSWEFHESASESGTPERTQWPMA